MRINWSAVRCDLVSEPGRARYILDTALDTPQPKPEQLERLAQAFGRIVTSHTSEPVIVCGCSRVPGPAPLTSTPVRMWADIVDRSRSVKLHQLSATRWASQLPHDRRDELDSPDPQDFSEALHFCEEF